MVVRQRAMTVLAPIREEPGHVAALEQEFRPIRRDVVRNAGRNSSLHFENVKTLHYARFVILDEHRLGGGEDHCGPMLLFSTQHDGSTEDHLEELVAHGRNALAAILEHCAGFDAEEGPLDRRIYHYLKDRVWRPHAFYRGTPRRSVGRILWEEEVAGWIREAAAVLPAGVDPTDAWRSISSTVLARLQNERPRAEKSHGDQTSEPGHWIRYMKRRTRWWRVVRALTWVLPFAIYLIFPLATLALLAVLALVGLWLRIEEEADADALTNREAAISHVSRNERVMERERALRKHEDVWSQNQLTVVSTVKPAPLRWALLRVVLFIIQIRAEVKFTEGLLHDLPTIHFAYWMVFDRGRRLLFVSNYDGAWAGYLDEFVEHAPKALTAIWSHCVGFPATRLLFWRGAADGRRFKEWARADQVPPQVWYSAYPHLSTENINCNTRLCEGLRYRGFADPRRRHETLAWLANV